MVRLLALVCAAESIAGVEVNYGFSSKEEEWRSEYLEKEETKKLGHEL